MVEAAVEEDLVTGVHDYHGGRLNMLQIGLGNFGTFAQNLLCPSDSHPGVAWLLEATSNSSLRLAAVGVEPVPEHVRRLRPLLEELPRAALVQAAVGGEEKSVDVYAITPECYSKCVQALPPTELEEFERRLMFLRNMSCVGQAHRDFRLYSAALEARCGVKVEMEPVSARAVTYGALARLLNFGGVEVLLIDAEGYDCKILQSMIDHCTQLGNDSAWPEVVQFETMGHANWTNGGSDDAEAEICRALERHGYIVGCCGQDTQLVREASLAAHPRLRRWVRTFLCSRCGAEGLDAMPLAASGAMGGWGGPVCIGCVGLLQSFGLAVFEGWLRWPADRRLASISSSGAALWAVDAAGRALSCKEGRWRELGGQGLRHVAASWDEAQIWAVDRGGRVLRCVSSRRAGGCWEEVEGSPSLAHLCISGDGHWVWGVGWRGEVLTHRCGQRGWRRREWDWLQQVSLSHDGSDAWAVDPNGRVLCRQSGGGAAAAGAEWSAVGGRLRQVAISGNGCHVWGVNAGDEVFHRHAYWGSWRRVPGLLAEVCSSHDGCKVWGLDICGRLWSFCCT